MRRLSVFLFCALVAAVWSATAAAASGDFNGDGLADLAVGTPYEDVGTVADAGAVNVLYGSGAGLSAAGNQLWHQDVAGVGDSAEPGDRFGSALAAGDFNGDGFADLAIGVPFEDMGTIADAGAVNVLYGSPAGLTAAGSEFWNQDASAISNAAEANDRFGAALAAGNFGKSARVDLAVGVPFENVGGRADAGAVNVLYGRTGGLSGKGDQVWHQNRRGIGDAAEANDRFGSALAAGNFGQSGSADLAVGVPLEDVGTVSEAGALNVIYGSSTGLSPANDQFWHKASPGIAGHAQPRDHFAWALAAADLGKSARTDLAVGIPLAGNDAGAVSVLYGTSTGLSARGNQLWHGSGQSEERFGWALAPADFDGNGVGDLAIGAPWGNLAVDTPSELADAGWVAVLYGKSSGLSATGVQFWYQDVAGISDASEAQDRFGSALAAANFGQGSRADLAVGVPLEDVGTVAQAGAVNVIYGTSTGLSAANDHFLQQDGAGIADDAEAGDQFGSALAPKR